MPKVNLERIASLLEETMTNAGIMDDLDELMADVYEEDPDAALQYGRDIDNALLFINKHSDSNYDLFGVEEWASVKDESETED